MIIIPPKYILNVGTSANIKKPIKPTKINEEYSKGEVTATSAFLAACDIKKCPKDPMTPRLIANVNWLISGIIKLEGKKIKEVINKANE